MAVSTYTREDNKKGFMEGYEIMKNKIKPSAVLCYGIPFKEMTGNIKAIDPYYREELIKKIGLTEFTRKYLTGELYPEI